MRGAFVHTYDAFYGPLSPFGAPNTQYIFAQPCRYVPQRKILQVQFPLSLAHAWLTHNAPALNGPDVIAPWVPAEFADYQTADQIVVSAASSKRFVYCRSEFVDPVIRPSYYRGLLIDVVDLVTPPWLPPSPLPPPPVPPPVCQVPGMACLTAPFAPAGLSCTYNIATPAQQWFQFGRPVGVPTVITVTQLIGLTTWSVWKGAACGGLTLVATRVGSNFVNYTRLAGENLWVQFQSLSPTSQYQFIY